jgi:hypothetical protein
MAYGGWSSEQRGLPVAPVRRPDPKVDSNFGAMSTDAAERLVQTYVNIIRQDPNPQLQEPPAGWTPVLDGGNPVWEAAEWLTVGKIECLLGADLSFARVERSSWREQRAGVIWEAGAFVALVDKNGRFEKLIDRERLVEMQARASLEQGSGAAWA